MELFELASVISTILEAHGDVEGLTNDALDYFGCLSLHDELQVGVAKRRLVGCYRGSAQAKPAVSTGGS